MATSSTIISAATPLDNLSSDTQGTPSRFEQMCERMKGTVTILGDIVTSDPSLWEDHPHE